MRVRNVNSWEENKNWHFYRNQSIFDRATCGNSNDALDHRTIGRSFHQIMVWSFYCSNKYHFISTYFNDDIYEIIMSKMYIVFHKLVFNSLSHFVLINHPHLRYTDLSSHPLLKNSPLALLYMEDEVQTPLPNLQNHSRVAHSCLTTLISSTSYHVLLI